MPEVFVGLGANVGDPLASLRAAIGRLRDIMDVTAVSSLYRTEPVGIRDQPDFLNAVVRGTTALPPGDLLERFLAIERDLGRERTVLMGPRTLDLDLLLYGEEILNVDGLTVPHPRMSERRFVLVPLAEIGADAVHPALGTTVAGLLEALDSTETVERLDLDDWTARSGG
jgi:2-amino-4-hydroxy-6-hydroxymethyldihydropteridine diphosphokinase